MRYMYEIVKNHHQSIDLEKVPHKYFSFCFSLFLNVIKLYDSSFKTISYLQDFVQDGSYSQQEMDEIRDHLSTYIIQNWI